VHGDLFALPSHPARDAAGRLVPVGYQVVDAAAIIGKRGAELRECPLDSIATRRHPRSRVVVDHAGREHGVEESHVPRSEGLIERLIEAACRAPRVFVGHRRSCRPGAAGGECADDQPSVDEGPAIHAGDEATDVEATGLEDSGRRMVLGLAHAALAGL